MKRYKTSILAALAALALLSTTACAQLDVVGQIAVTSFGQVLQAADVSADPTYGGWSLSAPDQSARFFWSSDFSVSAPHDVMMEVAAQPFVSAGLDPAKLPAGMYLDGKIMVGQVLGDQAFPDSVKKTGLASFTELEKLKRSVIGYHETLDHYGVDLGNGNKFEWAKDMAKNDKDIVFVLDPKMLVDAGVDPAKVTGWVFAKVAMKDDTGKPIELDKFLKPFNLQ
jgi:hypothetical protein